MDPKYNGKTVSRAQLNIEESSENSKEGEDEEEGEDAEEVEDEEEGEEEYGEEEGSDESSVLSIEPNVDKMDAQQRRNFEVLKQLRKEELGDGSESEIDAVLDKIEADKGLDKQQEEKRHFHDFQKASAVVTQKKVFDTMLHQRILMQKLLTTASRLPSNPNLQAFENRSANIQASLQTSKRAMKKHIKELQWLQKSMFKVAETRISFKWPDNEDESDDVKTE